ncbi:MAG: pitrilysin family protein [Pseudomonadota bacterium]
MIRLIAVLTSLLTLAQTAQAEVDIEVVNTPSGLTAWLVEAPEIPFVALEMRFGGGTSLDALGKRGSVNLMVGLLEEGAGAMDARGFAERTEELAASFDFDAYSDSISISARFLSENRDEAIDLLRLALNEPRFDQDAIDRVLGQVISGIKSDLKDPDVIARRKFSALAFQDHPYGSSGEGTEDSVSALTRDDLVQAHRDTMTRDRLHIAAVGDINAADLAVLLDTLLAELPEQAAPWPDVADYGLDGGITVVPFDTPQSVAVFGHEGIQRDDPDFFAAYILNELLGGSGFDSRLQSEVRVKRGLTYGVYTYLAPRDHGPLFLGGVSSSNDRVSEAVAVIQDEWARMANEGVSEEELELMKTYLTGSYPLRFDGNARIAGILVSMQQSQLGPDYVNTRNDNIRAVTVDDIRRVAARIMRPEDLHFVVVGNPQGLEASN